MKSHEVARDGLIAHAVQTRKIAPDRADDYRRLYDADPRGIHHLLTAPVEQGGLMAGNAAAVAPFEAQPDEYPTEWLAGQPGRGSVAFEDHSVKVEAITATGVPRAGTVPAAPSVPGSPGGGVFIEP